MFTFILLDSLYKLYNERSPAAVYHILTGKRSSQTIQDVHIFQLKKYFGIYKSLKKEDFNKVLIELVQEGKLIQESTDYALTDQGLRTCKESLMIKETKCFQGLKYDRISEVFFERLTLFIQLSSNFLVGEKFYIPITDNSAVQEWAKNFYYREKEHIRESFDYIYQELNCFLNTLDHSQASIFVDRLTGYNRYGLSREQIKDKYGMTYHDVNIIITLLIHKLIEWISLKEYNKQSPYLRKFLEVSEEKSLHTESAEKTYSFLLRGLSAIEIARIRSLKVSTIYDHIIEIAYRDNSFDYSPYLSEIEFEEISDVINRKGAKKLKLINEALANKYSYFQIRLVLAVNEIQ